MTARIIDGKAVAAVVMIVGIGFIAIVTGAIANTFVKGAAGYEANTQKRLADVVEPRTQRRGGNSEVGAQKIFSEEAMELHAHGVFEVGNTAHVTGCVP